MSSVRAVSRPRSSNRFARRRARIALAVAVWGLFGPLQQLAPAAGPVTLDALSRARLLYNQGKFDGAVAAASEARRLPGAATTAAASLVLGRAHLERFRLAGNQAELAAAREALRSVDPASLAPRDRIELVIGYAVTLYLEETFGAAAEMFQGLLDRPEDAGSTSRERVLDWWATAVDRQAQQREAAGRIPLYGEIVRRMDDELRQNDGSAAASYWLAAAARGAGDVDRAWNAALAGWVRAPFARDRAAVLRSDLDRLVTQAIIPDRARKLPAPQRQAAIDAMAAEWEQAKERWTRSNSE